MLSAVALRSLKRSQTETWDSYCVYVIRYKAEKQFFFYCNVSCCCLFDITTILGFVASLQKAFTFSRPFVFTSFNFNNWISKVLFQFNSHILISPDTALGHCNCCLIHCCEITPSCQSWTFCLNTSQMQIYNHFSRGKTLLFTSIYWILQVFPQDKCFSFPLQLKTLNKNCMNYC